MSPRTMRKIGQVGIQGVNAMLLKAKVADLLYRVSREARKGHHSYSFWKTTFPIEAVQTVKKMGFRIEEDETGYHLYF